MSRKRLELSDIIKQYGQEFRQSRSLTQKQKSVLSAIEVCRTSKLGFHVDRCTTCDHQEISYNSCRDRHCPKCQGIAQRKWINKRAEQILPVAYYHVVFTLPATLFPFSLYNKKLIYNLLFDSSAATLKEFGQDRRWLGGTLGFFGILHTWGQTLWHHPHVHFVVVGGALKKDGSWIRPKYKGKFLFPVKALSKVFRGKFMHGLERAIKKDDFQVPEGVFFKPGSFLRSLTVKDWVVYCKSPFKKAEHVIRYIGRYTHRVALSNSRLVAMEDRQVSFRYRDYKDKRKIKVMTLKVHDFLQRFIWHVLPQKFHRIRHYGFLANGLANSACEKIRHNFESESESAETIMSISKRVCDRCKIGMMVLVELVTSSGHLIRPSLSYGYENSG